jgi:hypothetical protein
MVIDSTVTRICEHRAQDTRDFSPLRPARVQTATEGATVMSRNPPTTGHRASSAAEKEKPRIVNDAVKASNAQMMSWARLRRTTVAIIQSSI